MTRIIGNETVLSVFLINELSVMFFRTKNPVRRNTRPEAIRHMTLAAGFKRRKAAKRCPNVGPISHGTVLLNQLNRNLDFWVSFFEYHLSSDVLPCGFWLNVFTLFHALTSFICVCVVYLCYSYSYFMFVLCLMHRSILCLTLLMLLMLLLPLISEAFSAENLLCTCLRVVCHIFSDLLKNRVPRFQQHFDISVLLKFHVAVEMSSAKALHFFFKSANHFFVTVLSCQALGKQIKNPRQTASGVIEKLTWTMHCYKRCRTRDIEGQMQQGETRNAPESQEDSSWHLFTQLFPVIGRV